MLNTKQNPGNQLKNNHMPPVCCYGFTLIELAVVISIIAIIAGLLMPSLSIAKEKAKVTKVKCELALLGAAIEMYADDHDKKLPPVRVNCNSDLADHWCQFPKELVDYGYVRKGSGKGLDTAAEDPFNPRHSYKYAAPAQCLLNGSLNGNFEVWVPEDFPLNNSKNGNLFDTLEKSPVRWVIWSMGPKPNSKKSMSTYAPLLSSTWYRHTRDEGVIVRFSNKDGIIFTSP
jgi:prepilin-type N-terminal cleavage/methylation domain-containing protein